MLDMAGQQQQQQQQQWEQLGDTTYTKIFVGGLAWETQRETMLRHFQQYGEILEAVVITDKNTGRSKGYGFVTFRDPEAARRACADSTPVIDGRRANCNLAALGANRSRPFFPIYGNRMRLAAPLSAAQSVMGMPTYMGSVAGFPHQQGFPYQAYGYYAYPQDYTYQHNVYNPYAGPFPQMYTSPGATAPVYPYMQFSQPFQALHQGYPTSQGYTVLPQIMQYGVNPNVAPITTLPQQFGSNLPPYAMVSSAGGSPSPVPCPVYAVSPTMPQHFAAGSIAEQQASTG